MDKFYHVFSSCEATCPSSPAELGQGTWTTAGCLVIIYMGPVKPGPLGFEVYALAIALWPLCPARPEECGGEVYGRRFAISATPFFLASKHPTWSALDKSKSAHFGLHLAWVAFKDNSSG